MKEQISYPKIGQFRNVVSDVNYRTEEGEKPTIRFFGTVKLHGTNAAVCMNDKDFWAQSRNNIITPESDNAGFAKFVYEREEQFKSLILELFQISELDSKENTIVVYGEWVGKGIQKGVGISQIEKAFFIFDIKVIPNEGDNYYLPMFNIRIPKERIFNIHSYPVFQATIDFNNPQLVQNALIQLTLDVEKQCPVSKAFDIEGLGEGIVWKAEYKGQRYAFKVKGERHSVSKVKKLAPVDTEKLNSIQEFVDYAVTNNRIIQGIAEVYKGEELTKQKMGDFIRWIFNDILAEESDTLEKNGLTKKDVSGKIAHTAKMKFLTIYNTI